MNLLNLILVLFLMIILIWRKIKIGYVLLSGAVLLMILFGNFIKIPQLLLETVSQKGFYDLLIIVLGIHFLSYVLQESKSLDRVINSLFHLSGSDKTVTAVIPSIIGLLPMPGGAMFSAPLVKEAGKKLNLRNSMNTLINFWFRHMWEYIHVIYPGFAAAVLLSGYDAQKFIIYQSPLLIIYIIIGYFFLLKGIKKTDGLHREKNIKKYVKDFFYGIWSILLVIILTIVFKLEISISLLSGITAAVIFYRINFKSLIEIGKKSIKFEMILMVLGIFMFKTALESFTDLKLVTNEILALGIHPYIAISFISFLMGVLTGITVAYVSIAFPLIPFLFSYLGPEIPFSIYMLSYIMGFAGILVSPTHLCLILTKEFFSAPFSKIYRKLIPMTFILAFISGGFFLFYRYFFDV